MSISTRSFEAITEAFHRASGIRLGDAKRQLVIGRLQKLARDRGMDNLDQYVQSVMQDGDGEELVRVVDKLTTNETYFFREPAHFDFLGDLLDSGTLAPAGRGVDLRFWSAASSSGEEAYSIAMLLADKVGRSGWQVVGTDLSTAMVRACERALYPLDRSHHLPPNYLKQFCLRGEGGYDGHLLIKRELRTRTRFCAANLMQTLPEIGEFDVIFLRNVLIYFDPESKQDIVQRVLQRLKPGGYLLTGHAESINGQQLGLRMLRPAIYQR
jgi:chemotaxis protein methyltransferase CheR